MKAPDSVYWKITRNL